RLADGRELRRIRHRESGELKRILWPRLEVEGRLLAASTDGGLGFYDVATGKELAFTPLESGTVAFPSYFDQSKGCITSGYFEVVMCPVQRGRGGRDWLTLGPAMVMKPASDAGSSAAPDVRIWAVPRGNHTLIFDRDRPGKRVETGPQYDVR